MRRYNMRSYEESQHVYMGPDIQMRYNIVKSKDYPTNNFRNFWFSLFSQTLPPELQNTREQALENTADITVLFLATTFTYL